jgi:hypothetical protein
VSIDVSQAFDFDLVALPLLFQFLEFKGETVNFFAQSVGVIGFLLDITLTRENLCLSS